MEGDKFHFKTYFISITPNLILKSLQLQNELHSNQIQFSLDSIIHIDF